MNNQSNTQSQTVTRSSRTLAIIAIISFVIGIILFIPSVTKIGNMNPHSPNYTLTLTATIIGALLLLVAIITVLIWADRDMHKN